MKCFLRGISITIIAISSLSACVSDKARSEKLFEKYCNEERRVGQFIYERVASGEEYFRPLPTDEVELRRIEDSFYIDNKRLLIDKERFMKSYTLNYLKRKELSPIGPILRRNILGIKYTTLVIKRMLIFSYGE